MGDDEQFPTTQWTLLARVGLSSEEGRAALARLLERYLPALRTYLRRAYQMTAWDTEDVVQGFVLEKFLEKEMASRAEKECGKFRSLLITSMDRFIVSRSRQDYAQKRDHRREVSIDQARLFASAIPGPDEIMEITWARATLNEALRRMREECAANGRDDVWGVFDGRLLAQTMGRQPLPYTELALRYSLESPTHAANLLSTGKRMFARILKGVVADYEPDSVQVEQEIKDLRNILNKLSS